MSRLILFGGIIVAALLSAGAATLALEISKLEAHQRSAPADPVIRY